MKLRNIILTIAILSSGVAQAECPVADNALLQKIMTLPFVEHRHNPKKFMRDFQFYREWYKDDPEGLKKQLRPETPHISVQKGLGNKYKIGDYRYRAIPEKDFKERLGSMKKPTLLYENGIPNDTYLESGLPARCVYEIWDADDVKSNVDQDDYLIVSLIDPKPSERETFQSQDFGPLVHYTEQNLSEDKKNILKLKDKSYLEMIQQNKDQMEKEILQQKKIRQEQIEQERKEEELAEKQEQDRMEKERLQQEKIEQERKEQELAEKQKENENLKGFSLDGPALNEEEKKLEEKSKTIFTLLKNADMLEFADTEPARKIWTEGLAKKGAFRIAKLREAIAVLSKAAQAVAVIA